MAVIPCTNTTNHCVVVYWVFVLNGWRTNKANEQRSGFLVLACAQSTLSSGNLADRRRICTASELGEHVTGTLRLTAESPHFTRMHCTGRRRYFSLTMASPCHRRPNPNEMSPAAAGEGKKSSFHRR